MTVETLRKLVALDPKDALSRFALGRKLLEKNESVTEAVEHLQYSNQADPTHLATYGKLAEGLMVLGRKEEARDVLNRGIARMAGVGEGMGRDLGPMMEQMLDQLNESGAEQAAEIRLGRAEEVIDLRHKVLRQDLGRETAVFPGDELPTTLHGVAIVGGTVACCATMMRDEFEGKPAWRLRGMATDPAYRSMKLGGKVLAFLEKTAEEKEKLGVFWCAARVGAVRFYEKAGWRVVTKELYEIPTAGLHHTMVKRVRGAGA